LLSDWTSETRCSPRYVRLQITNIPKCLLRRARSSSSSSDPPNKPHILFLKPQVANQTPPRSSQIPLLLAALAAPLVGAVPTVSIQGADFINSATGKRFQILGVAYQPGGSAGFDPTSGRDPLSDGDACLRDAALMQRLGACVPRRGII
jgi:hypothetical protein